MRKVILTLFLLLSLNAYSIQEFPTEPILAIQQGKAYKEDYEWLERYFNTKATAEETPHLALLLAAAPEEFLEKSSHLYADYALRLSPGIAPDSLRIGLLRQAADGLFQEQSFARAQNYFDQAYELSIGDRQKREVFLYKSIWCDLNLDRPEVAYQRLKKYKDTTGFEHLKEPMLTDLGRSFGEAHYAKKTVHLALDLKPEEAEWFTNGLIKSARRSQQKWSAVYPLLLSLSQPSVAMETAAKSGFFQDKPCVYFHRGLKPQAMKKAALFQQEAIQKKVSLCAKQISQKKTDMKFQDLYAFSGARTSPWTLALLMEKSGQKSKMCPTMIQDKERLVKEGGYRVWIDKAMEVCSNSKEQSLHKDFYGSLMTQKYVKEDLVATLEKLAALPAIAGLVLNGWLKENSKTEKHQLLPKDIQNFISYYSEQDRRDLLESHFSMGSVAYQELWMKWTSPKEWSKPVAQQYVASRLKEGATVPDPSWPDPINVMMEHRLWRQTFQNWSWVQENWSEKQQNYFYGKLLLSEKAQLSADFKVLKDPEARQSIELWISGRCDETACAQIASLPVYKDQKTQSKLQALLEQEPAEAKGLQEMIPLVKNLREIYQVYQDHPWSSEELETSAQKALLARNQFLYERLRQLKGDERSSGRMVARELKRWRRL